jgi:GT2 family glycosyltransferase
LGTFTREALNSVGGYDESLIRNQDYELNWRLRQAGYLVWFDPKLKVDYRPRDTLKKLASQYFQYGAWKRRVILKNPRSLRMRQLVAPGLVLGLLTSVVVLALGNLWGLILPATYLASLMVASLSMKAPLTLSNRIAVMKTFATMHLSWGWGFLTRLAK